jgi:predicted outer membrane repeat protein
VPTTFFQTVVSNGDAGGTGADATLTLRQAINRANNVAVGDDTVINFSLPSNTITIGLQLPRIDRNVTINGTITIPGVDGAPPTTDRVTVTRDSSAGQFRLFLIHTSSVSSINNLRLTGGDVAGSGGAIRNDGYLTLSNDVVSNNTASAYGGAIYSSGSALIVDQSVLSYNTAGSGGGAIGVGQGGSFSLTLGSVRNNSAPIGGGIYLGTLTGSSSTISGVVVYNNVADDGGGIYSLRSLTLDNYTDIHDNQADATTGKGGGVYLMYGTITYTSVLIGDNDASSGDGVWRAAGTSSSGTGVTWYGSPADQEVVGT